jgi:hypothetical protein
MKTVLALGLGAVSVIICDEAPEYAGLVWVAFLYCFQEYL